MKTQRKMREGRKQRIRKKIRGDALRPRMTVFRSNIHIYAQVIDDDSHATLASASTLSSALKGADEKANKREVAKKVGLLLAQACKEKNIQQVVFDRNGYLYHGRVKALAEGAREGGLRF